MAITVTPDLANARNVIDVQFVDTAITKCTIERRDPNSPWVYIRSGASMDCTAGHVVAYDFEPPFDVGVEYRAIQLTPPGTEQLVSAKTVLASRGSTWLKDPTFPSKSMRLLEVTSLPQLTYGARAGVFSIIDRPKPIAVAARRQSWTGELKFTTQSLAQRDRVNGLLERGQVLLLSTPGGYGIGNQYLHVGDVVEERLTELVTEATRAWTLPITCVERPAALASAPLGMRWVDVKFKWPTWDALKATGMTWDELLEYTEEG